jgi:hypothetical protein
MRKRAATAASVAIDRRRISISEFRAKRNMRIPLSKRPLFGIHDNYVCGHTSTVTMEIFAQAGMSLSA